MSSEVHVYELIDPRSDKRFYIGITNNENQRLKQHANSRCESTREVVEDLRASGLKPKMVRLATCSSREFAEELEAALTYYHKRKPNAWRRWRQKAQMTPPRQGAPWSSRDQTVLRDSQDAGKPVREIAILLQRSRGAVTSRLTKMERTEGRKA
jgi:predicted GIY-YIG superfamily endonuclease